MDASRRIAPERTESASKIKLTASNKDKPTTRENTAWEHE
jgi:hypothetical protein